MIGSFKSQLAEVGAGGEPQTNSPALGGYGSPGKNRQWVRCLFVYVLSHLVMLVILTRKRRKIRL